MPVYEFECGCGLVADYLVSFDAQEAECEDCGESAIRTGRPHRVSAVVKTSTPHSDNITFSESELDRRIGEDAERKWSGDAPSLSGRAVDTSADDLEYRKKIEGIMKREAKREPSVRTRKDGPRILVGSPVSEDKGNP